MTVIGKLFNGRVLPKFEKVEELPEELKYTGIVQNTKEGLRLEIERLGFIIKEKDRRIAYLQSRIEGMVAGEL